MLSAFLHGGIMGFSIAAVIGPIGILCLKQSFSIGFKAGIAVGIGAACADALLGSIAFFGLSAISTVLFDHADVLRIIGGFFLIYLGFKSIYSHVDSFDRSSATGTSGKSFDRDSSTHSFLTEVVLTFFLTLLSPVTILSFLGFCSAFGIESLSLYGACMATLGVFIGSMVWWCILTTLGVWLRDKMSIAILKTINTVSGIVIASFGIVSVIYGCKNFFW